MDGSLDNSDWPPGTVRLEDLERPGKHGEILLQPRPTSNPNDPLIWPQWRKYLNFALVTLYVIMVSALINVATPTWGPMQRELGFSNATLNDSYAIGCAMLAVGALVLIPFALKYGRRPVSSAPHCNVTTVDLWLVNVFSCFLGALFEVIVQMTVADVFFVLNRGTVNSLYIWSVYIGAKLTPVIAGCITASQGWRWAWWWMAIFFGATFVAFLFFYEETKFCNQYIEGACPESAQEPPVKLTAQKHDEESKIVSTADDGTECVLNRSLSDAPHRVSINPNIPINTYWQRLQLWTLSPGSFRHFCRHSYQPLILLFTLPAIFFASLVYGGLMAASYVMTTALSELMTKPPYNFNSRQIGLMSLAPWIGSTIDCLICGPMSDWAILGLAKRNQGIYEPEMRLWTVVVFIPFVPAGIFLFGIGLEHGLPWSAIAVGWGLCLVGMAPTSSIVLTYITDSYTEIVADSLVGVTFTRNVVSTIFVFALSPWISSVGTQNVFLTIGILLTAIILGTVPFIFYGKKFLIMTANRYHYYAERQIDSRKV